MIKYLNEKGNPIPAVRSEIREQTFEYLEENTVFKRTPNGNLYFKYGEAQDGSPVYVCLEMTVTMIDPTIKKKRPIQEDKATQGLPNPFKEN